LPLRRNPGLYTEYFRTSAGSESVAIRAAGLKEQ